MIRRQSKHCHGFPGGSRVAMRLALAYPDVFRAAILDAGSDPIGSAKIPLPARDLFARFQESSHLVYLTGADDVPRLGMAAVSMRSMRHWCVFGLTAEVIPYAGHEVAGAAALSDPSPPDPDRLAACRSTIDGELTARLGGVESLMAGGQASAAQHRVGGGVGEEVRTQCRLRRRERDGSAVCVSGRSES